MLKLEQNIKTAVYGIDFTLNKSEEVIPIDQADLN